MKKLNSLFALSLCWLMTGCFTNPEVQQQLDNCRAELTEQAQKMDVILTQIDSSATQEGDLLHSVYLPLKNDLSEDEVNKLITEIKGLRDIPSVKNLHVGSLANTGDQRMLAEFDIVMALTFEDLEGLEAYQVHEIHQTLKAGIGTWLSGAPKVHDAWIK